MKIKVGFTYDAKSDYAVQPDALSDKYAEFDDEQTILEIETALKSGSYEVVKIGNAKNLINKILSGEKWDIVFNICEGIKGRNREAQVPAILELYDIPYVGSDALTMGLTLDKILAKKVIEYHNLRTTECRYVSSPEELNNINEWITKRLPVILKPSQEGTSKGISEESLCHTFNQVEERTHNLLNVYNQPILIEQFIKGYEFTVAIIGNGSPEVLPPVQVAINDKLDLGDDFYTYQRVHSDEIKYICPSDIDTKLDRKLRNLAIKSYEVLGCKDVGRIDTRVDYNLEPYFLECNPLPYMGTGDVFPLVAEATNRTYEQLICYILESALKRYGIK